MCAEISRHLSGIIEPLCNATAQLLREVVDLDDNDRLHIAIEDDVYDLHDGQGAVVTTKRFVVTFKSSDHERVCSRHLRGSWWSRIPGVRPMSAGYGFYAPPSDTTALIILGAVGRDKIVFEDETSQLEFMTAVLRFAKQAKVTRGPAGFKQFRAVPNDAPSGNAAYPPMPGQRVGAWAASQSEGYALWMEQSTGKTYTAIMTIEAACKPGQCQSVFIVCPKNVRTQWQIEIQRFASKRVRVFRLIGGALDRLEILLEAFKAKISGDYDYVVVLSSYQLTVNSISHICAYPWDWAITDEGHFHKWHRAKRTIAVHKLRDRAKRRLTMTGTPIANSLFDLYAQLEFLGRGWSGFTSYDSFRKFYGNFEVVGHGVERLISVTNLPLLQERLARMSFMLKKTEALPDLPPKTYEVLEVEMTEEQEAVYKALAEQLYAEIEHDLADAEVGKKTITTTNILTKLLRLSQITSGFAVCDADVDPETGMITGSRPVDRFDPNPKLEELVEYLKGVHPLSKVLIWCCYTQDIKTIVARLRLEGIRCASYYGATNQQDREDLEREWNSDPDLKVFVGNPAAGGVGLNLQGWCPIVNHAGAPTGEFTRTDVVIFYSQNWSATTRSQGEERPRGYIHESKTTSGNRESWSIHVVDLCVPDTIDMQIRMRVTDKRRHALKIQDVREILATLLT